MSRPTTRPSNLNKHPGQVVIDANRVQHSRKEVATETKKQGEKDAQAAAVNRAHTKVAAKEDDMAIQQNAQLSGPPKLVRPRPRMVTKGAQSIPAKEPPTMDAGQLLLYFSASA